MADFTTLQVVGALAGSAGAGGGASAFFSYLTQRGRQGSIAQDAVNRAVKAALDSTTREIVRLNDECEALRGEVKKVRDQATADHEECERRAAAMQAEINRLMAMTKPAAYTELKRVAPRD